MDRHTWYHGPNKNFPQHPTITTSKVSLSPAILGGIMGIILTIKQTCFSCYCCCWCFQDLLIEVEYQMEGSVTLSNGNGFSFHNARTYQIMNPFRNNPRAHPATAEWGQIFPGRGLREAQKLRLYKAKFKLSSLANRDKVSCQRLGLITTHSQSSFSPLVRAVDESPVIENCWQLALFLKDQKQKTKNQAYEYPWILIFADKTGKDQGGCGATLVGAFSPH